MRGKFRDATEEDAAPIATRETQATDWGAYAGLVATLEEEARQRGASAEIKTEAGVVDAIMESLQSKPQKPAVSDPQSGQVSQSEYWNAQRAAAAEAYTRDLVYGGNVGFAYVRSLAEFVRPNPVSILLCLN